MATIKADDGLAAFHTSWDAYRAFLARADEQRRRPVYVEPAPPFDPGENEPGYSWHKWYQWRIER